jgi:hypothetical protein
MVKFCKITIILVAVHLAATTCGAQEPSKLSHFSSCWHGFDGAMNRYADSLNLIDTKKDLPKFLDDYLLDWEWRNLWQHSVDSKGGAISYRKLIIDRVSREDVLTWIISSNNKNYDKVYKPEELERQLEPNIYNEFPDLPFMKYSIRSLAKMRLDEIKNHKLRMRHR